MRGRVRGGERAGAPRRDEGAREPSALAPMIVRLQRQAGNAAVAGLVAPPALIVDDEASDLQPGQMRKSEFLDLLRAQLIEVTDAALAGTIHAAFGCPLIEQSIASYRGRDAASLDRARRRFAPETATSRSAADAVGAIAGRVSVSVRRWAETGEVTGVPDGLAAGVGGGEGGPPEEGGGAPPPVAPGGAPEGGAAREVRRALGSLGAGRPLDAGTRGRLGPVFGEAVERARVHDDAPADALASSRDARAVAMGDHIALARGEGVPGTPEGEAVLAHELAHVVQQQGAEPGREGAAEPALEEEADRVATGTLARLWLGVGQAGALLREVAVPRLRSGLRLSRCGGGGGTTRSDAGVADAGPTYAVTARGPDQHAGVTTPDQAAQAEIFKQLFPSMTLTPAPAPAGGASPPVAVPTRVPWDGASGPGGVVSPAARTARATLKRKLDAALKKHLDGVKKGISEESKRYGTDKMPMTDFEGAGTAAQKAVEGKFGGLAEAAARTGGQAATRHGFTFQGAGPGRNLLDAYDPADRAAVGAAINAAAVLFWMAERDDALAARRAHHFTGTPGEEEDWLVKEVIDPMAKGPRKAELERYDQFGFALTPGPDRIVIPSTRRAGAATAKPAKGRSPAERGARWDAFTILVHEYIHTMEHPTFERARRATEASGAMGEGFCEYFTKQVMDAVLPGVRADTATRSLVEDTPVGDLPPLTEDILPKTYSYNAGYAADVALVQAILPKVNEDGVRASFFQGHVEVLGLNPDGTFRAPTAPGTGAGLTVPAGIGNLGDLAKRFTVKEEDVRKVNPGLAAGGALPARVNVPGWREHLVVSSKDAAGETAETRAQIATQNGVTEASLDAANPGRAWAALKAGDIVYVDLR